MPWRIVFALAEDDQISGLFVNFQAPNSNLEIICKNLC